MDEQRKVVISQSKRILQVAHNHPSRHPGGTEITALALHRQALQEGIDSWYLGALDRTQIDPKPGTNMIALTPDNREAAIFVHSFDTFRFSQDDTFGFLTELRNYLAFTKPDIVHIHHLLGFGLESLYVMRSVLPHARIVLTLHDYYYICARYGQLYKAEIKQRCDGPELHQCLKCLPGRKGKDFELRALDIRNALSICDQIVSPSWFLKTKFERYFGAPIDIAVVENGYVGPARKRSISPTPGGLMTFAYLGNIAPIKGLGDLLEAADILQESRPGKFQLAVHGSQLFPDAALEELMARSRKSLGRQLRFHGRYETDDLEKLLSEVDCLVFPSVWWENAPLVIYEALHHRCPVIAYPHGGGAEILKRYGAGIIAERSDPQALADAMATVLDAPPKDTMLNLQVPGKKELLANYTAFYFDAE